MKQKFSKSGQSLLGEISKICEGLFYISEIDAAVEPFFGDRMKTTDTKELVQFLRKGIRTKTETADPIEFLEHHAAETKWHTSKEQKAAKKFGKLKKIFETRLTDIRLVRMGRTNIAIYVIGLDRSGEVIGIRTSAVET
jgi:hypothetical protein